MAAIDPDERVAFMRRAFEAYAAGDMDAVLAAVHPEIEIVTPQELGNPGVRHGVDGSWSGFGSGPRRPPPRCLVRARSDACGPRRACRPPRRHGRCIFLALEPTFQTALAMAGPTRGTRGHERRIESAAAMPLERDLIGKTWPAAEYEVGREKIREYANAVGENNPIHHDPRAAREAGFRNVVAPPMFCVVYSAPAMGPAILDPELEINLAAMVHGGQEFEWGEPVCAGDVITTTPRLADLSEKDGMSFYVFESTSTNQDGDETVRATWTNIVRGG
jgi:acyl dehydratase